MQKQVVRTPKAPQPLGPYSQGIRAGNFVFVSAQAPIDPNTGKVVGTDIESQTRQVLENIRSILETANLTLSNIARTTVVVRNVADFKGMNDVYRSYFPENPPARTTVEARLPSPDMLVTIDAIACS
jgi:2-iminobutanoate/2-iminopropanoate deaminase